MDKNKRIWIRMEDETNPEIIMQDILNLIQEDEEMAGEIPVMLFGVKSCMVKRLSSIYDLAECSVNVLKEKYGDYNVKFVSYEQNKRKSQEDEDEDFMYRVDDIRHKLNLLHRRGFETKEGLMLLVLVELEGINASLGSSEYGIANSLCLLSNCVSDKNTFCTSADITGEIGTY